jgi:hypothetical protein
MKRISIIGIIVALLVALPLRAQQPSIKVSAKPQVAVGEQFKIAFEANAEGKQFSAPSFNGFTVVGGPFNSTSSSVQIINGSMSRSVSHTFSYVLRAEKEGTFTIGAASLVVDGETVTSEPYTITVTAAAEPSNSSAPAGSSSGTATARPSTSDPSVSGKDLFFTVSPSKKTVYVGEPVVMTYKLYTRVPVSQLSVSRMPSYGGFWMREVGDNSSTLRQTNETVNGIEYTVAEVKKVVLVPQKSGTLTIEPMGLDCIAQIQTQRNSQRSNDPFDIFFNDPFFNRSITNVQKNVETPTINLTVKNLPTEGRPDSFSGAVGNYNFSTALDRDEVRSNEAVTVTVTVSGSGNIELLNLPTPNFPPDFEVYDPKIVSNIDANGQGMSGTKKAEVLAIPRRAGDFTLPPMEFSYFNPAKGTYVTLHSPQHEVHVEKGSGDEQGGGVYASNQEGVKHLGSDIRHIVTGQPQLKPLYSTFFGSLGYILILAFLVLLFVVVLVLVKRRRQFRQDVVLVRNKQATKVAKGRLKKAYAFLKENDQDHFYEELSQALWGYISDKLGIERSVLSMDTVKEAMVNKGIHDPLPDAFVDVLNSCEFARFAPGDAASKMKDLYDRGLDLIMKVEKAV